MPSNAATLPASIVTSLTVGDSGLVSAADQEAESVVISGTLSEALTSGDSVDIQLASGALRQAIVSQDGVDFSLTLIGTDTIAFGLPGQVSAFVVDASGNHSATFTQSYVAASARSILPVTSTPSDFSASAASALALSGDGTTIAFVASQTVNNAVQFGLYVERLDTGTLTLVSAGGRAPSLSGDGNLVAFLATQNGLNQTFVEDLTSGLVTPLSDPDGGSTSGDASSGPSIADDGTVVFESAGDAALDETSNQQVLVASVSGGVAIRTLISVAPDGTLGNGTSEYATISADGSTVVFLSNATNLLAAGDPHTAALTGTLQIYARALRDNPATGQVAGTTVLVSLNADGSISDGTDYNPVVSGDGRYVLYQSVDGNSQVHLVDLLTGVSRIVSTNAEGDPANAGVFGATLSADGNTVVFETTATNLLDPGAAAPDLTHSQQVYAKNLTTGQVTLLSEGGYIPGDAVSQDPAISADGSVAAFASTADNLAPGVLGSANRAPTSRGYVTTVATTPALSIDTPAAALPTATAVLTGTIDPAHAETPIVLTDSSDPGFLPVTATVTAGSDPYSDSWTATVIFTQAGAQSVTASAGGASVQAAVTVLTGPSLTIDPVNGTDSITATGEADHATIVTGSNPAAVGSSVSLFLRTDDGKLLPLGSSATAADGTWSVSVPDAALGSQSSESDALLAETVDANGDTIRASQAIGLTVAVAVSLYGYRFTYTDGSFYTGTVADDGSYGYVPGQAITTALGRYVIGASAGTTDQAPGTVTAATYYDVSSSASYVPASGGAADGNSGLGSETDSITGPGGVQNFGGGVAEARQSAATAYGFAFVYNDGSAYFGTVAGDANSAYLAGQVLSNSQGFYQITGSQGATTQAVGTVDTSLYYDATSATSYVPVLFSQGQSSGATGLGSEVDTVSTATGATAAFGLAGVDKAAFRLVLTYQFTFYYPDGSAYYGYVVDDGTYGYAVNQTIKVQGGIYDLYAISPTPVTVGGQSLVAGDVSVYTYYDKSTNVTYTPADYTAGIVDGSQGLGSELDFTEGDSGAVYFGADGTREAKQAPDQLFTFTFTYTDGSYYGGQVVDDGSYGYYVGETIRTSYGHYSVNTSEPLSAGEGGLISGQVFTKTYFDITSGGPYTTLYGQANQPSGTTGLGSESDAVLDPTGVYRTFGDGGRYEARLTPYTLLNFSFDYPDGSFYKGQLSSDGTTGPQDGQILTTAYGYYDIYGYGGATAAVPGTVTINAYYDVTDKTSYAAHPFSGAPNFGTSGLPLAVGYVDPLLTFGYGGEYEAKHNPNTLWGYQFYYTDGSYYTGTVVDNGQSGYFPGYIQNTPYGFYNVSGVSGVTALPVGSVTIDHYYDVTTGKVYVPTGQGAQGIDGTTGLGSEYADTTDNFELEFGFGGQLEARQSDVRSFTFIFRYTDGTFYSGTLYSAQNLYLPGTIINVANGYYNITALTDEHSSQPSGMVSVSSYFAISTGQFYTPVHYSEGLASGTAGLGSELDYIVAGGGLKSFGGPGHSEANTGFATTILLTPALYAFDGPIEGATVGYLDPLALPGTLSIDPKQPTAATNADGSYQLDGGIGPLVLTGGTDIATGLPFRGALESAGTGPVLSPVTTLLEAVARARGDTGLSGIAAATTLVATALGLPAGLDLTTYLPGEILRNATVGADDIPGAETVYRAGAALLDAETLIDAGGGASLSAIDTVAEALADGSVTDLTDVSPLIEDGNLIPQAEIAIRTIITATDAALDHQLAGVTNPDAILALISGASIALQGNAASAFAVTGADDTAVATTYVQSLDTTLQAADQKAFNPSTACYCRGTSILTTAGEIRVEALRVGDRVITASGARRPIEWIGHRAIDCARHRDRDLVSPVLVSAGAFAPDMPRRDLLLSPDHAVFSDGVLIPVKHLINGRSIAQVTVDTVEYWHVELDSHDVLLAEGLPCESYLDTGNRSAFANGGDVVTLHPDFAARDWDDACAPLVQSGSVLQNRKALLFRRAGIADSAPATALCVQTDANELIPERDGCIWLLRVPIGARSLRLISPPWVPAHCLAASLDRRILGVRVLDVWVDGQLLDLAGPGFFTGFHGLEMTAEGPCRWTDGDARLVLPPGASVVAMRLDGGVESNVDAVELLYAKRKRQAKEDLLF